MKNSKEILEKLDKVVPNPVCELNYKKDYEERIAYINTYIGSLGYNIYEKNEDGTLNYLGRTDNTTFTVSNPKGGNTTYVIKAAYSLFKANMSDGLLIKSNSDIDSNVENIIKPYP